MVLSPSQKSLIERIINCYETGTPDGKYGAVSIYADGPHDIKQITYGRSQTTEYGNLRALVQRYIDAEGAQAAALRPFIEMIGNTPLVGNAAFIGLLKQAGNDPVMRRVQDRFFEDQYFKPAMKWADQNGFTLPLSALVVYDSLIHSGSILSVIRSTFPEVPPSKGGQEKAWTKAYVIARHRFLSEHHRPAVRNSNYRTADLLREISRGNWDLSQLPIMANGTAVTPKV